jgi:TetR/AcrR family fatty acid metabolism transcriptional regulator
MVLTDPSVTVTGRREELLRAAAHVFADKGFHGARISDVAEEAGVAYGLVYHYFRSKDELLESIFRESWGRLVAVLQSIADTPKPALDRLRLVATAFLRTWQQEPDVVRVLVREVGRGPQLQDRAGELGEAFAVILRVIEDGQASGEIRSELDARLTAWIVYGGIEELLTGWVLGQLDDDEEAAAKAERTLVDVVVRGIAA